jgi:hypothetical protein
LILGTPGIPGLITRPEFSRCNEFWSSLRRVILRRSKSVFPLAFLQGRHAR